jgi:hypothetical protein
LSSSSSRRESAAGRAGAPPSVEAAALVSTHAPAGSPSWRLGGEGGHS